MDSLNPKAASFLHRTFLWGGRVQVIQVSAFIIVIHVPPQRDQAWAPLIHASAPFPQENGLSTSIHATSSPSEEDLCNSILYYIYAHSSPSRPDPSASILAPSGCRLPKRCLNAGIRAQSQHVLLELVSLPVVDLRILSHERPVRRVMDSQLECGLVVLVNGGCILCPRWIGFYRRSRCSTCMGVHRQWVWFTRRLRWLHSFFYYVARTIVYTDSDVILLVVVHVVFACWCRRLDGSSHLHQYSSCVVILLLAFPLHKLLMAPSNINRLWAICSSIMHGLSVYLQTFESISAKKMTKNARYKQPHISYISQTNRRQDRKSVV